MKPDEICELVIQACREEGATDTVVSVSEVDESMIRFSNNQITVFKNYLETKANIFSSVRGKRAATDIADFNEGALRKTSKKLVRDAESGPEPDVYAPLPEGPFEYDEALTTGPQLPFPADKLVGWVESAINAALDQGAQRVAGSLTARNVKVTLQTSSDVYGEVTKPTIELSLRAFASDEASGHSVSVSGTEDDFEPGRAGEEAGMLAGIAKNPISVDPGEYDTIMGPLVYADVASQAGRLASAFYVEAGLSFLAEKIGEEVASEVFTLTDDSTIPGTYGAAPFDSEGLPTRKTPIIDQGVLKSYLHNSTTSKKFDVESTANAGLIAPRPFNLIIGEGDRNLNDLISQVDEGIYVTNDWYLRYQNWRTGDFSMIPRDAMFTIKDGAIDRPIKEMRISDNILRILKNTVALSGDREWIKWWEVGTPTLTPAALVEDTKFTKSTM